LQRWWGLLVVKLLLVGRVVGRLIYFVVWRGVEMFTGNLTDAVVAQENARSLYG
jgi:hypothetical protein